jgi:hypothetical protein
MIRSCVNFFQIFYEPCLGAGLEHQIGAAKVMVA